MSEDTSPQAPTWFWVVAALALLWNIMGVMAYIGQVMVPPEMLSELPSEQREYLLNIPAWATGAFAIAVWGGVLGTILLLLRRKSATIVLVVSLIGLLVQQFYGFFMGNALEIYGPTGLILPILTLIVSVFLIWMSDFATKKGWMR